MIIYSGAELLADFRNIWRGGGGGGNLLSTPFIPNCKSFQESWRVKAFLRLTKIIEWNTKICNVKWVYYENIIKEESNDI